ncbi:PR-1-like protein [Anaeromyces robustus]|uniref:PR-1-like protein n=1 Tax=Anaeromyces robustus TaxID=1754192 RepID=A0A1Y1XHQ1_9FUNG|nr:PR-1-like protein [Anaeromyces robustus]|eukprot:ORX85273.1 PR-1-like protein [Anaeromyces robustus]
MKLEFSLLLSITALLYNTASATLSSGDKSNLLSMHKSTRSGTGASDTQSLSWDEGLAASAESYAKKCPGTTHDRSQQNLAKGKGSSVSDLYRLWADEKNDFLKSGQVDNFTGRQYNGEDIGHYSQIVWAKNTRVGCGFNKCNGFNQLVCHYGTGNIKGQKVYSGGQRGSKDNNNKNNNNNKKTTTTTKKTTTTTTIKPTTPVKQTKQVLPSSTKKLNFVASTTKNVVNTTKGITSTVINGILNTNSTLTTKVPFANATPTPGVNGVNGVNGANGANGAKSKDGSNLIIIEEDKGNNNTTTIVTGVAITGSVVGAAAAFVFLKKNPKQYEKLSRSFTSVKRGATVITRKFTTKKVKPTLSTTPETTTTNTTTNTNTNENDNNSYRIDFTENLQSQTQTQTQA